MFRALAVVLAKARTQVGLGLSSLQRNKNLDSCVRRNDKWIIGFAAALITSAISASEPPPVPADLKLHASEAGWMVTSSEGRALYTYEADRDHPDAAACKEVCMASWALVLAPADAKPVGQWAPLNRQDGAVVWAYQRMPVYTSIYDTPGSGFAVGDGVDRFWRAVFLPIEPPQGIRVLGTPEGRVLTDSRWQVLFTKEGDDGKASACIGTCLAEWNPVTAPWLAQSSGHWSVMTRSDDGSRQWAYRGKPLYAARSNTTLASQGWRRVVLDPPPGTPPWVTTAVSDFGPVFADQTGRSLYRFFNGDLNRLKRQMCDDACIAANWTPMLAESNAEPIGYWTLRDGLDGKRQWAYKGGLVFTFVHDKRPGDTDGDKFAGMNSPWSPILADSNTLSP